MGGKIQSFPLKVHNRLIAPQNMESAREGLHQSCSKKVKLQILEFIQIFLTFSLTWGHMGVKSFKRHVL